MMPSVGGWEGGAGTGTSPGASTGLGLWRRWPLLWHESDNLPRLDLSERDILQERANSDIIKGVKRVKFWATGPLEIPTNPADVFWVNSERYSSYPDWYHKPTSAASWESAPAYVTVTVKKYFHKSTATCTSFDISQHSSYDVMYPWPKTSFERFKYERGKAYHSLYNTEHVVEAQTIGNFFDDWLPNHATTPRKHYWVEENFFVSYQKWGREALISHIIDELGRVDHLDRLTVFMTMPNQHKGRLMDGKTAVSMPKFATLDKSAEQLLAAREIGMVFLYLNHDEVWQSYCATYNGILDRMVEFDDWYKAQTGVDSKMREEWPKFIRSELDTAVHRARENIREINQNRKSTGIKYTML